MSLDPLFDPLTGSPLNYPGTAHPNPVFQYLTTYVPRRQQDLFRWAEFLQSNSPHIYATIQKFGTLPITELVFTANNPDEIARHKKLFTEYWKYKSFFSEVTVDKYTYGNALVYFYEPFKRWLECPHCHGKYDSKSIKYAYDWEKVRFTFTCPEPDCGQRSSVEPQDEMLRDPAGLQPRLANPKYVSIKHNAFSGHATYYYKLPPDDVAAVRRGERIMCDYLPKAMLQAVQKNKVFRFNPGAVYHLKMPAPTGVASAWGISPLTATFGSFLFAATLRKGNEAIAMEYITPMRVVSPVTNAPSGDPLATIDLGRWKNEFLLAYRKFRRDPLHFMVSPVDVNVKNVGGDGRALLVFAEIQEAEKNILLCFGITPEFLLGGLGRNSGEATLRMTQNTLQCHTDDLNGLAQWMEKRAAAYLGYESVPTAMEPFELFDDEQLRTMLFQIWGAGKLSDTQMGTLTKQDPQKLREQREQEAIAEQRSQLKIQAEVAKIKNSLAAQAQAAGRGQSHDNDMMLQEADQVVEQLAGLDEGSRRSQLSELEGRDYSLHAVVVRRLEDARNTQTADAKAQMAGQPGAMG